MLKLSVVVASAALMTVGTATTAHAAGLDTSFGTSGVTTTDFALGSNAAQAIAVSPTDGKIMVAGADGDGNAALARYTPGGTLDTSFSEDGRLVASLSPTSSNPARGGEAIVRQPDGKIIVSGGLEGGTWELLRFNPSGTPDTSFGTDGVAITKWSNGWGADALVLQPDGKVIAVGSGDNGWAIARYTSGGELDTTFSGDGKQLISFGVSCCPTPYAVALSAGGKILVAGDTSAGFSGDATAMTVAQLTSDGDLDTSFSGDGIQPVTFTGTRDHAAALAVSDTKIVIAGYTAQPGGQPGWNDAAIARLNADGSPDVSFSGDGVQTTDFGGVYDSARALLIQPDGKPVIAGSADSNEGHFTVVRYTTSGAPDTGFSGDGIQQMKFSSGTAFGAAANALTLQPDSKILIAGRDESRNGGFATARLTSDGGLDSGFATGGVRLDRFGGGSDVAYAAVRQPDGKILVAGNNFSIARYTAAGALDPTFSDDGMQSLASSFGSAYAITTQADGMILAGGTINNALAVTRYKSDGNPDSGFGTAGTTTINTGGYLQQVNALAVQTDGSIVLAGASSNQMTLKRLTTGGANDSTFSVPAALTTAFGSSGIATMLQQPDGKLVLFGSAPGNNSYGDFSVARINPDGSLDTSFSDDGLQTVTLPVGAWPYAAALDTNGKIVVAGAESTYPSAPELARLSGDGSLDTTFSDDGIARVPWPAQTRSIGGISIDANHRVVVAGAIYGGTINNVVSGKSAVVARYEANGALDSGFGTDGLLLFDLGADDQVNDGFQAPDGQLIVAGSTGTDFAIASVMLDGEGSATDTAPPQIVIGTPAEGQHFSQGQTVEARFTCTDALSAVDSCAGAAAVDTAIAGTHAFTVEAADHAGNHISKTVNYIVDAPTAGDGGHGTMTTPGVGSSTSTPTTAGSSADTGQISGAGDTAKPPVKPPVAKKPLTAAQKRAQAKTRALKACKRLKSAAKRAACTKAVNKKYAPKARKPKKTTAKQR